MYSRTPPYVCCELLVVSTCECVHQRRVSADFDFISKVGPRVPIFRNFPLVTNSESSSSTRITDVANWGDVKRRPLLREGFQKGLYKRVRMTMKICSLESPSVFCSDFGRRQNKQRARPKHTLPPCPRMSRTTTMCHNYRNAKIITWTNAKHIKWP